MIRFFETYLLNCDFEIYQFVPQEKKTFKILIIDLNFEKLADIH